MKLYHIISMVLYNVFIIFFFWVTNWVVCVPVGFLINAISDMGRLTICLCDVDDDVVLNECVEAQLHSCSCDHQRVLGVVEHYAFAHAVHC